MRNGATLRWQRSISTALQLNVAQCSCQRSSDECGRRAAADGTGELARAEPWRRGSQAAGPQLDHILMKFWVHGSTSMGPLATRAAAQLRVEQLLFALAQQQTQRPARPYYNTAGGED